MVEEGSPARRCGVGPGDVLLSLNGEPVKDLIDYEALSACRKVKLTVLQKGEEKSFLLHKSPETPLGLCFASSLMDRMQTCRNRCAFCFIDQMPRGIRSSLNVKDDDWRLSFIMGNYVSLTNVSDGEFNRILARKVSPLYVSVHATEPALRVKLMSNPTAGRIMERLTALKEAGLFFHTQIVLCPGLNDGEALKRTLGDLASLYPACRSVAAVPVGLTRFREGLYPLRGYTPPEAAAVIDYAATVQAAFRQDWGEDFFYLSDEWYLTANRPLPPYEAYGDFPQIENGVGLLRLFEGDFLEALREQTPLKTPRRFTVAGGTAANPFFKELYGALDKYGITVSTVPVENRFFGGNVHVAGLVTGSDLLEAFKNGCPKTLLLPRNMLREREDVFLDGMTVRELEEKLSTRVCSFKDGNELVALLFSEEGRNEHE